MIGQASTGGDDVTLSKYLSMEPNDVNWTERKLLLRVISGSSILDTLCNAPIFEQWQ